MARVFSSRQVGKMVGADPSSVNRWIDSGKLSAYRTPGGHRRVLYDDLVVFLQQCGMPLPDELLPENKRVLLVDTDEANLKATRRALLRADKTLEVETCASSVDALLHIGAHRPDIVVLDASMPGVDGVEVCQRLQSSADTRGVMVIAVAGKPTPALEKRLLGAGAVALLPKPIKAPSLLEAFAQLKTYKRARA